MDEEIIRIKCPRDGSVLTVRRVEGIESKYVTCPICKTKMRFGDFKIVTSGESDNTQYGGSDDHTQYGGSDDHTQYGGAKQTPSQQSIGRLTVKETGRSYQLRPGVNIIGRWASKSAATIQLECPSRRMSREHLVVEVKRLPHEGYVHYARLYKSGVNATFINGLELAEGDVIILRHGNVIGLPDVELVFTVERGDEC